MHSSRDRAERKSDSTRTSMSKRGGGLAIQPLRPSPLLLPIAPLFPPPIALRASLLELMVVIARQMHHIASNRKQT